MPTPLDLTLFDDPLYSEARIGLGGMVWISSQARHTRARTGGHAVRIAEMTAAFATDEERQRFVAGLSELFTRFGVAIEVSHRPPT